MGAFTTALTNLITPPGGRRNTSDLAAVLAAFGRSGGLCGGRLSKVSTNLSFGRVNGLYIPISGNLEEIPSSPATLAATSATPDTTYLIYAFLSGGAVTLERSTTAWALDTTWGYPVKSGDNSRTLVGIARAITGPAWVDTAAFRGVASWWNPVPRHAGTNITANRAASSTSLAEIHTEIRFEWVMFPGECVDLSADCTMEIDDANGFVNVGIAIDSTTTNASLLAIFQAYQAAADGQVSPRVARQDQAEGYHFATVLAQVSGAGVVATFSSGRAGLLGTVAPGT